MAYRFQVDELQREYDAVLIAVGAQRSQRLSIPGEELHSVIPATTFLKEFNLDAETHISGEMAVIGGGSTALDAARSALRSGASKVRILYRRTCEDMPAQEYVSVGLLAVMGAIAAGYTLVTGGRPEPATEPSENPAG